jgi:hypothetical protein
MMVEGRKMDLKKLHIVPFGTIIMIHTPKQPNNTFPRSEMVIVLGPNEVTCNSVDTMAIFSKKIMIRHQYTILKHIPKEFPYRLHNQPITPALLIKKIHALEKKGTLTTKQNTETLEPDDYDAQRNSGTNGLNNK